MTWIMAATMGRLFVPTIDPQHNGLLTYPNNFLVRLGHVSGMERGRRFFKAHEMETLADGELLFKTILTLRIDPPTLVDERPGTTSRPSVHDTTTLHERLRTTQLLYRHAQLESENRDGVDKEDLHTSSFMADTYILIRNSDKASWIQLWTAERGATAVQSLPSGTIEDLRGAKVTTIETLRSFECPTGGLDLIQMGKAQITAHHHIQTNEGWMTARQAVERGHGTLLSNHTNLHLYGLRLVGGGSVIIDTSVNSDKEPTQIEAATMGYRYVPTTDSHHGVSHTYPTPQEASPIEEQAAQAKPSYCSVAQRQFKGMSGRPASQLKTLAPTTIAQLVSNMVTERADKKHMGEPNRGSKGLPATSLSDLRTGQRVLEELGGDLEAVSMEVDRREPGGPLQSRE